MGGNKTSAIAREPVLKWGMERFQEYLSKADTRLVAIGYGFRDHHINTAIVEAAGGSQLSLYVVNPDGAEAANWECQGGVIPAKSALYQKVSPLIRGTSQRQLNTTFGRSDRAEHGKLIRWLGLVGTLNRGERSINPGARFFHYTSTASSHDAVRRLQRGRESC